MRRKRSSSSSITSSAAIIIGGHDDLLLQILLFLPAISLIRFKVVSKHWQSLISAPSFYHLHTLHHHHRSKPQPSFLLRLASQSQFFICHPNITRLVPFHFPFPNMKILQSCNGLLLLECPNSQGSLNYYVCNPTTMQLRNLLIKRVHYGLCLVFDPSKSPHYRVFSFKRTSIPSAKFLVYDSESHKWNDGGEYDSGSMRFSDGIYWNDGIYFIRYRRVSCFFNLGTESFLPIPNPPRNYSRGSKDCYKMESNGHMHSIMHILHPPTRTNCLYVFEMDADDHSWFIKYSVDLSPISAMFASNSYNDRGIVLGMMRGEKEEDSMLLLHVPGKILIYRFHDEVVEVLVDFSKEDYSREGRRTFGFEDAHQFIDSLALV